MYQNFEPFAALAGGGFYVGSLMPTKLLLKNSLLRTLAMEGPSAGGLTTAKLVIDKPVELPQRGFR